MSGDGFDAPQSGDKHGKGKPAQPTETSKAKKKAAGSRGTPASAVGEKRVAKKASRLRHEVRHAINGIEVVTPDGRAPGKTGAQGYIHGRRIKKIKLFETVRSCGVAEIEELTASVRAEGIIEPLVVRLSEDGSTFELVAGHRRLQAAKAVGGAAWEHVPVIIRLDLQDDDDKAIAVAVAENSPDGRSNLDLVDIGRQSRRLKEKGWTVTRIAREMALHEKKVRRALYLMEVPKRIQEKVRSNELSVNTALELHKLPPQTQRALEEQVGSQTTAREIRLLRKRYEREEAKREVARGDGLAHAGRRGSKRPITMAWKSPKEMKREIVRLAAILHSAEADDIGSADYHEVRGALGVVLWCRGDLEESLLPSLDEEEMNDPQADTKINKLFAAIVANEAARLEAYAED